MTIFLSDMEACFAYMLLPPMGHESFFIGIVALSSDFSVIMLILSL